MRELAKGEGTNAETLVQHKIVARGERWQTSTWMSMQHRFFACTTARPVIRRLVIAEAHSTNDDLQVQVDLPDLQPEQPPLPVPGSAVRPEKVETQTLAASAAASWATRCRQMWLRLRTCSHLLPARHWKASASRATNCRQI